MAKVVVSSCHLPSQPLGRSKCAAGVVGGVWDIQHRQASRQADCGGSACLTLLARSLASLPVCSVIIKCVAECDPGRCAELADRLITHSPERVIPLATQPSCPLP